MSNEKRDTGFSLTLGISLLIHAAALGTVAVFAAQTGTMVPGTGRPALEVVWVSDVTLAADRVARPTGAPAVSEAAEPRKERRIAYAPGKKAAQALRADGESGETKTTPEPAAFVPPTATNRGELAAAEPAMPGPPPALQEEPVNRTAPTDPGNQAVSGEPPPETAAVALTGAMGPATLAEDDGGNPPAVGVGEAGLIPTTSPFRMSRPEYPVLSRRLGEEGTVLLAMRFGTDGLVSEARVERSSGFARLDGAAIAAARAERMEPAGAPNLTFRVAYTFRLEE